MHACVYTFMLLHCLSPVTFIACTHPNVPRSHGEKSVQPIFHPNLGFCVHCIHMYRQVPQPELLAQQRDMVERHIEQSMGMPPTHAHPTSSQVAGGAPYQHFYGGPIHALGPLTPSQQMDGNRDDEKVTICTAPACCDAGFMPNMHLHVHVPEPCIGIEISRSPQNHKLVRSNGLGNQSCQHSV